MAGQGPTHALFQLLHHMTILEAMLHTHKAPQATVREWMRLFAEGRKTGAACLCAQPRAAASPPLPPLDAMLLLKPLIAVAGGYADAGAALLTEVFESLLSFTPLFDPGVCPPPPLALPWLSLTFFSPHTSCCCRASAGIVCCCVCVRARQARSGQTWEWQ